MSNCPDFLRGCRAAAGSQRDLTPSEHERITGQAAELSDYAKCSYCGLVYARSTSSTRRLGWLDGIAGLGFKTATPGLGLLLKCAPASRPVCGSPFFPAE